MTQSTTDDAVIERVARALYAVEWAFISGNDRAGHFLYEDQETQEYWRKSARAAIKAYKQTTPDGG